MVTQDKYKWTILYTDHKKQYIHYHHLLQSNPDSNIIKVDISNNYQCKFAWRNADKLVREWLKNNKSNIRTENIIILDWDVLVTEKLPSSKIVGLQGADVITLRNKPRWNWFKDLHKLGQYKSYAIGVAPLAVLFMNIECVNIWLDSEFDHLYEQDIFSELRLPTILNSRKVPINKYHLPKVHWKHTRLKQEPGIYHPIKYNVL